MNHPVARLAFLVSVSSCLLAADALAQREGRGRGGRRAAAPVLLQNFTYERVEFEAPSLHDGQGRFGIYLPVGYADEKNASRRYPLVIWLHGMNEDDGRFHSGGARVLDQLRGEGKLPELVFVAANAGRRTLYLNGERSGDIEDLIVKDLLGYLQSHYRLAEARAEHALMGVSAGGMGALKIAFRHPELFGTVAVHSAAILPADPAQLSERFQRYGERIGQMLGIDQIFGDPIDEKKWAAEIPMAIVRDAAEDAALKGLRIYFDAGTEDRYGFGPPNQELHELMEQKKIEHTFEMIEGGGHSWGSGSLQKALVNSLEFVGAGLSPKAAEAAPASVHDAAGTDGSSKPGGSGRSGGSGDPGKTGKDVPSPQGGSPRRGSAAPVSAG